MTKNKFLLATLIAAGILVAVVGGVILLSKNSNSSESGTMPHMNSSQNSTATSGTGNNEISTDAVNIKDFAFSPSVIKVKLGATVTWTNKDSVEHSVIADQPSGDAPSGPRLAQGKSYSFTFTKAGSYAYHCGVHPSMKGTVVVSTE